MVTTESVETIASVVPKQSQKQNDRNRKFKKPKQGCPPKIHDKSPDG
jgi:hypothetical protein